MYKNLLGVMKLKSITGIQIANLLECRQATISDKLNGVVSIGFSFDEARKIKNVLFPEYDYDFLFDREKVAWKEPMFGFILPLQVTNVNENQLKQQEVQVVTHKLI